MQLDRAEWGSDLPSVESHLENHKNVHKAIEEFESSLKEAKISEVRHHIFLFLWLLSYWVTHRLMLNFGMGFTVFLTFTSDL